MKLQLVYYALAMAAFFLGALDLPRFGTLRCISVGMALLTLALLMPLV